MRAGNCKKWRRTMLGMAGAQALLSASALAGEITAFKLTGVEGNVQMRYLVDEQTQSSGGAPVAQDLRRAFETEVFVLTHSYVYHPNLLNIDLGLGPIFAKNEVEAGGGENKSHDTLYNLTARLNFLDQKPYPFTLYYDHLNPTVSVGVNQSFVQESTREGANFSLREPLSPVLVHVDAFRLRTGGHGLDQVVDAATEQATVRASTTFGPDGYGQLNLQSNRLESRSGSLSLPIQPTLTNTDVVSVDSRHLFGARRQAQLTQLLSWTAQETLVNDLPYLERRDVHFSPDLRWQHTETASSFYRYNLFRSEEDARDTRNQSAAAGYSWTPDDRVSASAGVRAEHNETTGLGLRSTGVIGSVSVRQPSTFGEWRLAASLGYDRREREASAADIPVIGERVTLTGLAAVTLQFDFINAGSIRVFRTDRSQEYVLNVDFEIIVLGARTQIRRTAGSAIADGQEVLVDYTFQAGGSAIYSFTDQSCQAGLTMWRVLNVYARYRDAQQDLISGAPTLPLNSSRNTITGVSLNVPFRVDWMAGGEISHERHREDIAPYDRDNTDAYLEMVLPAASALRLNARRVRTDNYTSAEDVDLTGYGLRLRSRPWSRATLTVEATRDDDTGGTRRLELETRRVALDWRLRQLTVQGEMRMTRERLGDAERERNLVAVTARRDF